MLCPLWLLAAAARVHSAHSAHCHSRAAFVVVRTNQGLNQAVTPPHPPSQRRRVRLLWRLLAAWPSRRAACAMATASPPASPLRVRAETPLPWNDTDSGIAPSQAADRASAHRLARALPSVALGIDLASRCARATRPRRRAGGLGAGVCLLCASARSHAVNDGRRFS
jgi:hypothetical protein